MYNGDQFRKLLIQWLLIKANLLGTANTNWQDLIFRNTASFDSNLSLMGNLFDKIPSRLSIGHTENEGLLLTSNYKDQQLLLL